MSVRLREERIFMALLVSITAGAIVLMALGNNPPSAGAFSLSLYYRLEPIEKVIFSRTSQSPDHWNRIEIYHSGTKSGNVEQLAALSGLASPEEMNCHFVVCNGLGGDDGQIQPTEKWQRQWSVMPEKTRHGSGQTIRICIIADGKNKLQTEFQIKRVEELVKGLCRNFRILSEGIYYPDDWK